MSAENTWMHRNARPLDLARWRYLHHQAKAQEVLNALSAYQNPDGGFGHALEPDSFSPHSSPIQTWAATQILRELKLYDEHIPLVKGLADYLMKTSQEGLWPAQTPETNDHPHAQWWRYSAETAFWGYNLSASLLGYLLRLEKAVEPAIEQALAVFLKQDQPEMHELRNWMDLYSDLKRSSWDGAVITRMKHRIQEDLAKLIETDEEKWAGYSCRPSTLLTGDNREFHPPFKELIQGEKEYIRKTQLADGSWGIPWHWDAFPEAFALSQQWWKSHQIIVYTRFTRL